MIEFVAFEVADTMNGGVRGNKVFVCPDHVAYVEEMEHQPENSTIHFASGGEVHVAGQALTVISRLLRS